MDEELIFEVTKLIAESDSIAESYRYCEDFTKKDYAIEKGECKFDDPVGWRDLAIKIIKLMESKK